MGGRPDPWTIPPTELQLEAMCPEAFEIARSWGWQADDITIQRVMTHAEAASNRDGRWMHDNYGQVIWGGTGERWDFLQLSRNGPPTGGDELRMRIPRFLEEPAVAGPSAQGRLKVRHRSAGAAMLVPVLSGLLPSIHLW